ncbi:MAG: hypothetical protein HON98_13835 [Chloroflexi bacterium]|jgi:hypothetical protein|nr:hypothetical protein [Chloroflexota bacterium]MBT6836506.1 hypothetical protein [Bacteroidota bacterium]MBT4001934.1 hypothetical protein [Chloroflexota bacterium]MBT4305631.1 hypothetical protein [Chloroflexota bacterium]MBT4535017.1 hypothetical protein [Chloroflexota bacterium]
MQKYYEGIQKNIENEDAAMWQAQLAKASVEDVKAFQENALPWEAW